MPEKIEKFSYSKLDLYDQCAFKYKLKYIDGNYFFNKSIATDFGTLIHETEENIAKSIIAGKDINYIALKNNIILKMCQLQISYNNDFYTEDKSGRTYSDKIYYYLNEGIYKLEKFMKEHPSYEIVGVELPFEFTYENKIFKGFIDRIFFDKATNKYIVQDIKTYALPLEHDKLTTPLQFVIYVLAIKEIFKCNIEDVSCEYYLPICDITQAAGTKGYIGRGISKLDKLFDKIIKKDFTPHPSPLCNWCEFCATNPDAKNESKYLCPYFSKWNRDTRKAADIKNVERLWEGLENHEKVLNSYLKEVNVNG